MTDKQTLLIEIGVEELPPTRLDKLGQTLQKALCDKFEQQKVPFSKAQAFVSPRRMAVRFFDVPSVQPSYQVQKRGPQLKAAYKDGKPTKALLGFAKSCQTDIDSLTTLETEQGSWIFFEKQMPGKTLTALLPDIISEVILKFPFPKKMRWADLDMSFIRPIHWITIVHGSQELALSLLGLTSSQYSYGHRAHFPDPIKINHADNYLNVLRDVKVLADYKERKDIITQTTQQLADKVGGKAHIEEDLLDQVVGLVEWPVPLLANFSEAFLNVPQEALISAMQSHQKCFPVFKKGRLLPHFILVSNIETSDPKNVIHGNERVMQARLADAAFFFEQDCQSSLYSRLDLLKNMVYQQQLGSLYQKSMRVSKLAGIIAEKLSASALQAERAGLLCKTDLVTNMVFEFPELQGIMAYYYAQKDNEPETVALALKEAYLPSHSKDSLPSEPIGVALALADRLDTLVGIYGIGLVPTGEKDPFALRRQAMGILRILIEKKLDFNLDDLLSIAHNGYGGLIDSEILIKIKQFCFERLKYWYLEKEIPSQVIDAVLAIETNAPYDAHNRIMAVFHFQKLAEAQSLAQANKRVKNILQKNKLTPLSSNSLSVNASLFEDEAEKILYKKLEELQNQTQPMIAHDHYQEALCLLATLKSAVDAFFESVLVMADNEALKQNRLALLSQLYCLFLQIADISKLAVANK